MTKPHNALLRFLSVTLCLVSLLLPLCSFSAQAVDAEPAVQAQNMTLTCAVRQRAYHGGAVIGRMEDGTGVTVLGEQGNYYKIDCYDMTGYIAKEQVEHKDGKYYVNCKEGSADVQTMDYVGHSQALELRESILALAKRQLGYPYVYGGTRPGGFDCSGLMLYLYGKHGYSLSRRASTQLGDGIIVAREGMQVGDLVFFRETGEYYPASHVGIYAGNNQIIHAGSRGIVYADLGGEYFSDYFLCARRVVNTGTVQVQQLPAVSMERSVLSVGSVSGRQAG